MFATKPRAVVLGVERIQSLRGTLNTSAPRSPHDAATRLLIGRLLAYDAQLLAWMRGLGGAPAATGLPNPLSLEEAGTTLDRLITTPNFPTS